MNRRKNPNIINAQPNKKIIPPWTVISVFVVQAYRVNADTIAQVITAAIKTKRGSEAPQTKETKYDSANVNVKSILVVIIVK